MGEDLPFSGGTAAAADANTVLVTKQQAKRFEPLRAALEEALAGPATAEPPPPPQVPANWYPDPVEPTILRWWDGTTWTEHTTPKP
ncbi:DUF2510 domain-containing protein [Nocardia cyriacigeorgica]|nr:DUF2510 domain-containing protein [Nocardia cyriacigeorgica]MBF6518545.1 DUF2510 domain-containing protein [Nocardia cyriacigeorgica]